MKEPKARSFVAPEPVMRAASAWLARRDGGFTKEEHSAFDRWCSADPLHAAAVAQLDQAFNAFDRLRMPSSERVTFPDPDLLAPRVWLRWLFAFGGLGLAAAAIAVLVLRPMVAPESAPQQITSSRTATDQTTLSDGSVVTLNRDTVVKVEFSPAERRVVLVRGEAHFEVKKDSARPFVVWAGVVATRAIGTAFNVRLHATSVEVLVTEGKVQLTCSIGGEPLRSPAHVVDPTEQAVALGAGHRAVVALAQPAFEPKVARLSDVEIGRELAWQPQFRELSNASLAEIVAELNRQPGEGRPRLVIADAELGGLRLGGRIYADRPEVLVRLLEKNFNIRAESEGNTILLRRAP